MKTDMDHDQVVREASAVQLSSASDVDLCDDGLRELGLVSADMREVRELAGRIDPNVPASISDFGKQVAEHASEYADALLAEIRNKDLDEAGAKLSQVVLIAKALNMNALSDRRSKIPVLGLFIDRLKLSTDKVMGQFESTKQQIDSLVNEVEKTQAGLGKRNATLEKMFAGVKSEYRLLGLHIGAGSVRLTELRHDAIDKRAKAKSPTEIQEVADVDSMITNLDVRVGNLRAMQQSALQTLPQIRVVQTSNQVLVDKFQTIKQITVPAWKRQFMLSLGLNEQKNAVELAQMIDETTNALLRKNAELLHRNSVETAKSNQRLVIDVDTLQHVQDTLIKTVEDVVKIQREGVSKRAAAEKQIGEMRVQLQACIKRGEIAETA